jgi:hypothetical protein
MPQLARVMFPTLPSIDALEKDCPPAGCCAGLPVTLASPAQCAPAGGLRFRAIENPRTFLISLSREDWRALRLDHVCHVTIDGPVLVFPDEHATAATVHLAWIAEHFLRFQSAHSIPDRKKFVRFIRDSHSARVTLACGYTWPGNPPGHICFAGE